MMMLGPDKKNMASVIMGKLNGETPMPETEEDTDAGLKASMRKLISCVSAKDEAGCVAAMKDFMDMYSPTEVEEEPSDEAPLE